MNEVTIMEMIRPYLHNGRVNGYELEEKVLSHFSKRQGYDIVNILADHNIDIDYEEDDAVNNKCDDNATVMSSSLAGPILFGDKGYIDITSDEFKAQVENSVKGGFELSFYGGLKMYDLGGLRINRC